MSKRSKKVKQSLDYCNIGDDMGFEEAEAFKLLRANLLFSLPDTQQCRIVGITSAMSGEGKSVTAVNLAYTIAKMGKKVLLLEADMRLPSCAKRLNLMPAPGLSNLLAGLNRGADVLQLSGIEGNMHVITAGDIPPNPSELLGSEQMKTVIDMLSKQFDFIIVDLPPVNIVSDALVVSSLVSGMMIMVRQGYTNQRMLAELMRQMQFVKQKILGFVLMQTNTSTKSYRRYYKESKYAYSQKQQ